VVVVGVVVLNLQSFRQAEQQVVVDLRYGRLVPLVHMLMIIVRIHQTMNTIIIIIITTMNTISIITAMNTISIITAMNTINIIMAMNTIIINTAMNTIIIMVTGVMLIIVGTITIIHPVVDMIIIVEVDSITQTMVVLVASIDLIN
jgi:hypothetical protein